MISLAIRAWGSRTPKRPRRPEVAGVAVSISATEVGHHAGQNHGRITSITENEVVLTELVRDAAGDWTRRESSLRLQETQQ